MKTHRIVILVVIVVFIGFVVSISKRSARQLEYQQQVKSEFYHLRFQANGIRRGRVSNVVRLLVSASKVDNGPYYFGLIDADPNQLRRIMICIEKDLTDRISSRRKANDEDQDILVIYDELMDKIGWQQARDLEDLLLQLATFLSNSKDPPLTMDEIDLWKENFERLILELKEKEKSFQLVGL